ncbi:MAG: EutP/PduV family microcompartment system protein [Desulfoprunum sp.]|nr:EutP/PduV family microcompartment system protein [Desulfoprunum sp.]
MKKLMLIGKTGCGKTTLSQSMQGMALVYRKTQAVHYSDWIVDTPGEFSENRRFYSALMASCTNCNIVGFVQDATAVGCIFPPKFASMLNKQTIGIISKTDLAGANIERAEKFLRWAGAQTIFQTSSLEKTGITTIIAWLGHRQPVPTYPNQENMSQNSLPQGVSPRESEE